MLRFQPLKERQPFTKKIPPAQNTTGVAITNSIHFETFLETIPTKETPGIIGSIANSSTGMVSTKPIQNFRERSRISRWACSSARLVTALGSRGMPHFGQSPGKSEITSGCMGHVYCPGPAADATEDFPCSEPPQHDGFGGSGLAGV